MKQDTLLKAAFSIVGIGLLALPARGVEAPAGPVPATQPAGKEAAGLVEQLGADDFHVREEAARKLKAMGSAATGALKEAQKSPDPEIRTRAEMVLQEINRPPALPVPQPGAGGAVTTSSVRVSIVNGEKSIDATEGGRTVHIDEGQDGIKLKVTGQIDGKEVTHDYKAKNPDELKKDNPDAYALYQQYAGDNGVARIQGGIVFNGIARLNIGGQNPPGGILPVQPGIAPMPNPNLADNKLEHLQEHLRQQMKDAKIPDPQQEVINGLLKHMRDLADQPAPGIDPQVQELLRRQLKDANVPPAHQEAINGAFNQGREAQNQEFNRQSDILRKKLAELHLPDPGDALPAPQLGIIVGEDSPTVLNVLPDSRAQKLGLKEQDLIQKVNGKEIHSAQELRKALLDNPKGVVIEGLRDGKPIKLEEKPEADGKD